MNQLIELKNIRKNLTPQRSLFQGLNLALAAKEFVCLLGPSGSGKSTLLRLIAGLDAHYEGTYQQNFKGLGFMFQEPRLLPWLSVQENIALPTRLGSPIQKPVADQVKIALERSALKTDILHLYPHQLSGGMKSRVSLARALVQEPELLILDEPFAALDDVNRFKLQEELRSLFERNDKRSFLMVTHSIQEAVFLAHRILILDQNGQLKTELQFPDPAIRNTDWRFSPEASVRAEKIRQELL